MKSWCVSLLCFFYIFNAQAESFLYFQNNTSLNVEVSTSSTLSSTYWVNSFSGTSEAWRLNTKVFEVNRNNGITNGSSFYLTTSLLIDGQTIELKTKLTGTFSSSNIWCSAAGPGFSHPWYNDYNFHEASFSVNGRDYILKYQFDLPPGNLFADMFYVLQEVNPFPPSLSDLSNPHVLNLLSYNVYMLTPPIGSSEETQRAQILHNYVHDYDVIIFNEAFYNAARDNELIPNLTPEYPYHSGVVGQSGNAPEDGGVIIFSRWPIVFENQIIYTDCDGSDCLSDKGVMYVKINKLGKPYHVFGTHTQAWPDAASVAVRLGQLDEMYAFMIAQNIPLNEPVIFGGDLNVNKANVNQSLEYLPMLSALNVSEPTYLGHAFTYDPVYNNYGSGTDREYLDFVFSENTHFCAYSVSNKPLILRHVTSNDDFWDNNSIDLDLSDHYAVQARLEYPYFTVQPSGLSTCSGDTFHLSAGINHAATYQWFFNNQMITGATDSVLTYATAVPGTFYCEAAYGCGSLNSNSVTVSLLQGPAAPTITQNGNGLLANTTTGLVSWYNDNGLINGAVGNVFNTCNAGNFYAVVSNANGCVSAPSNVISLLGATTPTIVQVGDSLFSSVNTGNQWYNDNGVITGANSMAFTTCEIGNYYVVATNGNCSSLPSNVINLNLGVTTPFVTESNGVLTSSAAFGNQWYDANGIINGANSQNYTPLISGSYYVVLSNNTCVSEASNTIAINITSIRKVVDRIGIVIFNNPTQNGVLNFEILGVSNQKNEISLYNTIGKKVHWFETTENKVALDVSLIASGTYMLVVRNRAQTITRKILINNH